jgi:hypothetical protein
MLRTLFYSTIAALLYWIAIDFAAQLIPEYAGRIAFTLVVIIVSLLGCGILQRLKRAREDLEVVDHKLDRINATVVDIQQNPLVELKIDPATGERRRGL